MSRHRGGFTMVEMLFAFALFGTMLAALLNGFVTGQSSFMTSEAYLQASQTARNALDVIQQDLAGADLFGYVNGSDVITGGHWVLFQRVNPGIIDGNGVRQLGPLLGYAWCPNGGVAGPTPCCVARADGQRELFMVSQTGAGCGWIRQGRVLAQNLKLPTDPPLGFWGFDVRVTDAAGNALVEGLAGAGSAGAARVDLTIRTASQIRGSQRAQTEIRSRVKLRNLQ